MGGVLKNPIVGGLLSGGLTYVTDRRRAKRERHAEHEKDRKARLHAAEVQRVTRHNAGLPVAAGLAAGASIIAPPESGAGLLK